MDIMRDIKPLSTFKRNAAQIIANIKATGNPAIITVNGNAEVVVQDAESYQEMVDMIEYFKNVRKIEMALAEVGEGKSVPAEGAFASFRKARGIEA
jgi:prevent-host-death family protein